MEQSRWYVFRNSSSRYLRRFVNLFHTARTWNTTCLSALRDILCTGKHYKAAARLSCTRRISHSLVDRMMMIVSASKNCQQLRRCPSFYRANIARRNHCMSKLLQLVRRSSNRIIQILLHGSTTWHGFWTHRYGPVEAIRCWGYGINTRFVAFAKEKYRCSSATNDANTSWVASYRSKWPTFRQKLFHHCLRRAETLLLLHCILRIIIIALHSPTVF